MASFNSVTFSERGSGGGLSFPIHGVKVNFSILKVPGGPKVFLQLGAKPPSDFSMPIQCTAAQLASLRGSVAVQGTLVYSWGSFTATLEEVGEPKEVKQPANYYQVTLKFKVVV